MTNVEKAKQSLKEIYDNVLDENGKSDISDLISVYENLNENEREKISKELFLILVECVAYGADEIKDYIIELYDEIINAPTTTDSERREIEEAYAEFCDDYELWRNLFFAYPDNDDAFERILNSEEATLVDKEEVHKFRIEKFPEEPDVCYDYAIFLDKNKEYKKAEEYYKKSIDLDYEYLLNVYNDLAFLLEKRFKKYDEAEKYYEQAVSGGVYEEAYINYYNFLIFLKEHEKAERFYEKERKYLTNNSEKITKITLKDYNQFAKNVELDFTYPKGHEKAGEPLEKICFIGQSGTGKTSILELLKGYISDDKTNIPNANLEKISLQKKISHTKTKYKLINYPAHSVENIKELDADKISHYEYKQPENIIDFSKADPKEHWYPILYEITQYVKKIHNRRQEIAELIETNKDFNDDFDTYFEKYKEDINNFKEDEKNPLKQLDEFLKPILRKFNLQVDKVPSKHEDIKFISIENVSYEEDKKKLNNVPIEFQSTGTKEILSRTVPLFSLKPENSIILIDEPENSLYPNVQKEFIDFLTKETWHEEKNCQFFFATHSPTIASSFEPWEIVEFQFNKNGKVEQKPYFKGERHVDNYKVFPKYLRLDKILKQFFKTDGDKARLEKMLELAEKEEEIKYLKETRAKPELINSAIDDFKEIAEKLNWDFNNATL